MPSLLWKEKVVDFTTIPIPLTLGRAMWLALTNEIWQEVPCVLSMWKLWETMCPKRQRVLSPSLLLLQEWWEVLYVPEGGWQWGAETQLTTMGVNVSGNYNKNKKNNFGILSCRRFGDSVAVVQFRGSQLIGRMASPVVNSRIISSVHIY